MTITGRSLSLPAPQVAGFGDIPLAQSPLQATVLNPARLQDAGAHSLADVTRFDASLNDAYNAEGYWSMLAIRGYTLDNRFNYRRDGLPINAETAIGLANKDGIEILKGTSGIQAGTSAPGGLVDFIVKRPERSLRSGALGWRQNGTWSAAIDASQRFGQDEAFGVRLNIAAERLNPQTRDLKGHDHLFALAGDWRLSSDTLLEAEIEHSHAKQRSVPGFSLLGDSVPDAKAIDPRTNLNNQAWALPVVLDGTTASLRWTHRLSPNWRFVAHAMTQDLKSDDRIAFPFGCSAPDGITYYADRFCPDGSFDMYDFRSENERRRSDALDLSLAGKLAWGAIEHQLAAGVLLTRFESRFQGQAFNFVGAGRIDGSAVTTAIPEPNLPNTNRDERSTEIYLRDAMRFGERWSAWLGLRHTSLSRRSVLTNGDEPTGYPQAFTTPWLALTYSFAPHQLVYASWGQGVESNVTPNRGTYEHPGAPLPAQKSRQFELGIKGHALQDLQWSLAAFDIVRPRVNDAAPKYEIDGSQHHRGIEAQLEGRSGAWQWLASASWLKGHFERTQGAALDGVRPPNVPSRNLKLMTGYDVSALPGLSIQGWLVYEGHRTLLPQSGSPRIGSWARLDAAARYAHRAGSSTLTWRLGVDNLADRRAWKEAPFQFSHVYLYPLAPRTWRLSLQVDL